MVRRPDLVLAAIPVLAVSGLVLERLLPLIASSPAVERAVTRLPLPVFGLLGALAVVLYALFGLPEARRR
jgi:hypothetical protein